MTASSGPILLDAGNVQMTARQSIKENISSIEAT
jgi:hypothetical protein